MNGSEVVFSKQKDPFILWKEGMDLDSSRLFEESASKFQLAAQRFFDMSSMETKVAKAYYEYSTLMDAYSRIQSGRALLSANQFDEALKKLRESAEILRSTAHYGFLAPYVSACAIAETADLMERNDSESLQAYKNAIALFEQSKIALTFRDDLDPTATTIEAYIRYCLSQALHLESLDLIKNGNTGSATEKESRSIALKQEFLSLAKKEDYKRDANFCYLPLIDFMRAQEGAFVVSIPDANGLWLMNIGRNVAKLEKAGIFLLNQAMLEPRSSLHLSADLIGRGKIRLLYKDNSTGKKFDEGCLLVI